MARTFMQVQNPNLNCMGSSENGFGQHFRFRPQPAAPKEAVDEDRGRYGKANARRKVPWPPISEARSLLGLIQKPSQKAHSFTHGV